MSTTIVENGKTVVFVRLARIELAREYSEDFKSPAATDYATVAMYSICKHNNSGTVQPASRAYTRRDSCIVAVITFLHWSVGHLVPLLALNFRAMCGWWEPPFRFSTPNIMPNGVDNPISVL